MRWFRQLLTEKDNTTVDLKRVLWAVGVLWFMGLETFAVVWRGLVFDPIATGTGFAGLLAAGGAALAMNRHNESDRDGGSQ